jgi:hypothetical protein
MLAFLHKIFAYDDPIQTPKIGNVELSDSDGVWWIYKPQEDITTYEVAKLMPLFATITVSLKTGLNWQNYVDHHNLWRHFEVKP